MIVHSAKIRLPICLPSFPMGCQGAGKFEAQITEHDYVAAVIKRARAALAIDETERVVCEVECTLDA